MTPPTALTIAAMSALLHPGRIVGHVDLFKRDPDTGEQVLISTTRPCYECGKPLEGVVVPVQGTERQAHASCRQSRRVLHAANR